MPCSLGRAATLLLPVAKRRHRLALRKAATSGDHRFFLGTFHPMPELARNFLRLCRHFQCARAGELRRSV